MVKIILMGLSVMCASLYITVTIFSAVPLFKYATHTNSEFEAKIDEYEEEKMSEYDNTLIIGSEVYEAIARFKGTDMAVVVTLRNVDKATGKIELNYCCPITIEETDDEEQEYIHTEDKTDLDSVDIDTKMFGKNREDFNNVMFFSRLILDDNGEVRGIYIIERS